MAGTRVHRSEGVVMCGPKTKGATSNRKLPDPAWRRRGSVQDCLRRLPTAGQRRLDSPHVRTGIEPLAGKEYTVAVWFSQHRQRVTCFRRRVRISSAGERIIAPVDRSRCNEVPPDALGRETERLGERDEAHVDEFGLGE